MSIGNLRQRDLRRRPFDHLIPIKIATRRADASGVLAQTDVSTIDRVARTVEHRPPACSQERSVEAEVLLQAITALRHANILTASEYEAKRQRLTAHL